jgi:hypothetical protein
MQEKTVDVALEAVVSCGTSALQNSAMCTGASGRTALAFLHHVAQHSP